MKNFSQINEARLNIQEGTINYISSSDLKKYLNIASNFISDESKDVINWLIVNNNSYIKDLGGKNTGENALASFYNKGVPSNAAYSELYKKLGIIIKSGRTLEIPVFQTKAQFESILDKTKSPDEIIIDLDTEKGRAEVAKKYVPLMHKICRQWVGKSTLSYDELMSAAQEGLMWAMNSYGKKTKRNEDKEIKSYTFGQFAAYMIRFSILEDIKNVSQTVRVPVSQQSKERKQNGHNVKSNSVSGDKILKNGEEGSRSLFDFIGTMDSNPDIDIDNEDVEQMLKDVYKELDDHFGKKMMNIYYDFYGVNGHKKIQNKDIAKAAGITASNVTYYNWKINCYIKANKSLFNKFTKIYSLMKECLNAIENRYNDEDIAPINRPNESSVDD